MKKILAMILSVMMLMTFAACSGEQTPEAPKLEGVEAPVDILNKVWENYDEANKFFAAGGDWDNMVDNAPGAVTNEEFLVSSLVCGGDATAMVDASASLMHAMNANTFTGAAYHLADAANKDAFVTAMKENINGNQWMCGIPEKMVIASLADEYIVVAFGAADIIDTFSTALSSSFEITDIIVDEALAI